MTPLARHVDAFLYGRRVLVIMAALLSVGVQIVHDGPVFATLAIAAAQVAALGLGGAPGALVWILFSRQYADFPKRRIWDGAMHSFLAVSIVLFLLTGAVLSPQFLGCSGALLLLSYSAAKLGCHRQGCCGWSFDREGYFLFQKFSRRIGLPPLEAALSFAGGALAMTAAIFLIDSTTIFLSAIAIHLSLRQLFVAVRSRERRVPLGLAEKRH